MPYENRTWTTGLDPAWGKTVRLKQLKHKTIDKIKTNRIFKGPVCKSSSKKSHLTL